MTTPTIFSDKASNPNLAKYMPQGDLSQSAVAFIPAGTANNTIVGMIRIQPGCTLLGFALHSDNLDTGTSVDLNVGYVYDGTAGENGNAYIDQISIPQTGGSNVWPISFARLVGRSPELTDHGYIAVTIVGGSTDTDGNISMIAEFTYDA